MEQAALIISLLKANLCNYKLITCLEKAGLVVEDFHGDLETVILTLMGFDLETRETELYDFYLHTMDKLVEINVQEFRQNLGRLAEEMYQELLKK